MTTWLPTTPLAIVIRPALLKVARPLNVVVTGVMAPLAAATIVPLAALVSVSAPPNALVPPATFQVPLLVIALAAGPEIFTWPVMVPLLTIVAGPPLVAMATSVEAPDRFWITPLLVIAIGAPYFE